MLYQLRYPTKGCETLQICACHNRGVDLLQDFFDNWMGHARTLGWSNVLVGAIDDAMQAYCKQQGIASLSMNSTTSLADELGVQVRARDLPFGTPRLATRGVSPLCRQA